MEDTVKAKKDRPTFFNIRHGGPAGDRLVMLQPVRNSIVVNDLRKGGIAHIPKMITLGYYQKSVDDEKWYFIWATTKAALALQTNAWVKRRIARDLSRKNGI